MEILLVVLMGLLYAAGIYMLFRRSMVKLLLGIMLLGNGTNILIFLLGRITKGKPPVIDEAAKVFTDIYADPIPQALILTAIVIGFAMFCFLLVLAYRTYQALDADNTDTMRVAEPEHAPNPPLSY